MVNTIHKLSFFLLSYIGLLAAEEKVRRNSFFMSINEPINAIYNA